MKYLLLILIAATCFAQTNTYTIDRTAIGSYASFNAYVAAKGSTKINPTFSGGTFKVIGKLTCPANINLSNLKE